MTKVRPLSAPLCLGTPKEHVYGKIAAIAAGHWLVLRFFSAARRQTQVSRKADQLRDGITDRQNIITAVIHFHHHAHHL